MINLFFLLKQHAFNLVLYETNFPQRCLIMDKAKFQDVNQATLPLPAKTLLPSRGRTLSICMVVI